MLYKKPPAVLFMIAFSVILLNRGEVLADFGSGTITFEESSYQLYTLTNTGGVATTGGATVDSATGEIWDIDGTNSTKREKFRVTATTTSTTAQSDSPTGDSIDSTSLDAKPWQWSFSGLSGSITQIKFTRFGDAYEYGDPSNTGPEDNYKAYFPLAFNNFNPVSSIGYLAPEPSSLLAFGGVFSLAVLRRRRRATV